MAIQLDEGGRTGGSMPSKKEMADLKRYAQELKMASRQWDARHQRAEADGAAQARNRMNQIIADARRKGDFSRVKYLLQAEAKAAQNEVKLLEAKLEMMKWHMVVDALSIIDPTPATTGVSIWMDLQEASI